MKMPPLSRSVLREIDRRAIEEFGIPGIALMENAGVAAAHWLVELGVSGPVVICCGKGNNAGDGFVIARHLDARGISVHVLTTSDPSVLNGDALVSFKILERSGLAIHSWDGSNASAAVSDLLRQADWLVDCLLGTGMTGVVREPMVTAIQQINSAPAKRLAIDIPSGLDCDTGQPCPEAVRADFTATFVATKLGFDQPLARQHTGMVQVFSIGICRQLLAQYART